MDFIQQENKRIDLTGGKTYEFPINAPDEMFTFHETRTQDEVRQADNATKQRLLQMETDKNIQYAKRREVETDNLKNMSSRLIYDKKWYSFFQAESPEMVWVKKMLTYLNNFLDSSVEKYFTKGGLDAKALKGDLDIAFDEAIQACNDYITAKREQNGGKKKTGARRLRKVSDIRTLCEQERLKYGFLVDAMMSNSLKIRDIDEIKTKTPRELTAQHRTLTTLTSDWQNKGNSTDVYRIKANENGKEVYYYIKENLPLISADPEGFLDRRIAQLEKSLLAKQSGDREKEEQRMWEAKMTVDDYKACLTLLRTMKNKIQSASDTEKPAVKKRIIELFSHDFDRMFMDLTIHNEAAKALEDADSSAFDRKKWEAIANDAKDLQCEVAKYILQVVNTQGVAAAKTTLKSMNAYEWVEKKLGLKSGEDKEVIRVLKNIYGEKNDTRLEHLFRTSLGKEVELFGQMRDRMKGDEREIAAANNTGTFLLADIGGFTDVVTESDTRIVRFKNREGEVVERFCTVTRAAEGEEFLELLKRAEKEKKKIDYSPKAIQQLMRLQLFDTLCLQVDRHGSNFKCKVDPQAEKEGRIVITEVMSYDHDMSFGEETLDNAFKDPVTKQEEKKKGFLPSLTTRIKKDSPMYHYVMDKYFGFTVMNKVKKPDYEKWKQQLRLGEKDLKKMMALPFYGQVYDPLGTYSLSKKQQMGTDTYFGIIKKIGQNGERTEIPDDADVDQGMVFDRFKEIFQKLFDNLYNKNRKKNTGLGALKTKFTLGEKLELYNTLGELQQFMREYDFSDIKFKDGITSGFLQCWMEQITYTYHTILSADSEFMDYLSQNPDKLLADDKKFSEKQQEQRKKDLKLLTDEKTGDLVIPSLLHYDEKAYRDICDLTDPLKEDEIDAKLLPLFRKSKIDAIKKRAREIKTSIEQAREKAEAFYRLAGWKGKKAEFLLDDADYEGIDDLTELSVDPGNTYLSIDNEKFLFGLKGFSDHNSSADRQRALAEEKKKRHDPKRWKDMNYANSKDEDENMAQFLNNPLRGRIEKSKKGGQAA